VITCQKTFSLKVSAVTCDNNADWMNNPGPCRLRIKNFVQGSFPGCPACANAAGNEWDGTFPVFGGNGHYYIAPGTVLGGKAPLFSSCDVNFFIGNNRWFIELACGSQYIWVGEKLAGVGPLGTYVDSGGTTCQHTPSVEIEAYQP